MDIFNYVQAHYNDEDSGVLSLFEDEEEEEDDEGDDDEDIEGSEVNQQNGEEDEDIQGWDAEGFFKSLKDHSLCINYFFDTTLLMQVKIIFTILHLTVDSLHWIDIFSKICKTKLNTCYYSQNIFHLMNLL